MLNHELFGKRVKCKTLDVDLGFPPSVMKWAKQCPEDFLKNVEVRGQNIQAKPESQDSSQTMVEKFRESKINMLMFGRNQHNIVKQYPSIKNK